MLMEAQQPGSGTAAALSWEQLSPAMQQRMTNLLEPLVRGLLFSGAAPLTAPVRGDPQFMRSFVARGPRDSQGRSVRDFDLDRRLFKYPLSFLIYSEGFDALPAVVQGYVYRRFGEILTGADQSEPYAHLSPADRRAILEILSATKPAFARTLGHAAGPREAAAATIAGR
jgi:hypothetical protein